MRSRHVRPVAAAAGLAAALAAAAAPRRTHAQPLYPRPTPTARAYAEPRPTRAVSVSPLLVLFGSLAGDYEQRVGERVTVGGGAQYDDKNSALFSGGRGYDFDVSLKLRYYPDAPALEGYSVGVLAGGTRYQRRRTASSVADNAPARTHTVPTVGFTLDHNALLGADKRFLVGVGAGAKRRFVRNATGFDRAAPVRPTFRLALGYAW